MLSARCRTVSRPPRLRPNSTRYLTKPGLSFAESAYCLPSARSCVSLLVRLAVAVDSQKHAVGRFVQGAVGVERPFILVVAGIELAVHGHLVGRRLAIHPRIHGGFGHRDGGGRRGRFAAVADRRRNGQLAAVLRLLENELAWARFPG